MQRGVDQWACLGRGCNLGCVLPSMFGVECIALWRPGVAKMWLGVAGSCCARRPRNGVFVASGVKGMEVDLGFGCRLEAMGNMG